MPLSDFQPGDRVERIGLGLLITPGTRGTVAAVESSLLWVAWDGRSGHMRYGPDSVGKFIRPVGPPEPTDHGHAVAACFLGS